MVLAKQSAPFHALIVFLYRSLHNDIANIIDNVD